MYQHEGILHLIADLKDLLAITRYGPTIVATPRLHPASGTKPHGKNNLVDFLKTINRAVFEDEFIFNP